MYFTKLWLFYKVSKENTTAEASMRLYEMFPAALL